MVKDEAKKFGWALSHLHRSATTLRRFSTSPSMLGFENNKRADKNMRGDITDFNKIMQAPGLSMGAAESCNLHLANYFE
jgi:hypothetical protein